MVAISIVIYARPTGNLGRGSALGMGRGLNALWNEGGLLYAPPMH